MGSGSFGCPEISELWGRWDSNPHCQDPRSCASCQLGYGPFLFLSLPANVGVCEWQFGQRNRRFSFLLSCQFPLIWSTCSTIGMPFHSAPIPHVPQTCSTPISRSARRNTLGFGRGEPGEDTTRICSGVSRQAEGFPLFGATLLKCDVSMPSCLSLRLMCAWLPPEKGIPK